MNYKYIISYRGCADSNRLENLKSHIEYLFQVKLKIKLDIFIIEQDSKPSNVQDISGISYHFLYNNGIFNKSWSYNYAYNINSKNDTFIFADCDCIMTPGDLISFLQEYDSSYKLNYDVISPYNNKSFKFLTETDSNKVKSDLGILDNMKGTVDDLPPMLSGGIFLIKGEAYSKIKGFNENFRGWGGEDNAFDNSVKFLDIRHTYLNIHCFHLWHGANDKTAYMSNQPKNQKLWEAYYTNRKKFLLYHSSLDFNSLGNIEKYKYE